ncbi:MAG: hypothetical protein NZ585_06060 [Chloracidobacterium sp.]|nr:hypothetical protein [Chloracidobacterium sp.]MDW8216132.1 prephenate dehydratase domain-containing protein [Acidobacteriota bacterium]
MLCSPSLPPNAAPRIAFQGEFGAYGEIAAARFGAPTPYPTFAAVCAATLAREVEFGVLPVRNVIAGDVPEAQALLRSPRLQVLDEFWLPIEHCLLGLPGATVAEATHVLSHWQALRQCAKFFARYLRLRPTTVYDTAGAAKLVQAHGRRNLLAIASRRAAVHYRLSVLAENIADCADNATCFVLFQAR